MTSLAERLDRVLIDCLKAVRLGGKTEAVAWAEIVSPVLSPSQKNTRIVDAVMDLLYAIHKAIWDRDTHVRNFKGLFECYSESELAMIGVMAVDARDFNHLRTRVVELLRMLLDVDRSSSPDPNLHDGRLADGEGVQIG